MSHQSCMRSRTKIKHCDLSVCVMPRRFEEQDIRRLEDLTALWTPLLAFCREHASQRMRNSGSCQKTSSWGFIQVRWSLEPLALSGLYLDLCRLSVTLSSSSSHLLKHSDSVSVPADSLESFCWSSSPAIQLERLNRLDFWKCVCLGKNTYWNK